MTRSTFIRWVVSGLVMLPIIGLKCKLLPKAVVYDSMWDAMNGDGYYSPGTRIEHSDDGRVTVLYDGR